jgi:hypothetical protein
MAEDRKSFVKITEQDIEIAREFFEDENLLKDWIYNVCMYYMGEPQIHNDRLEEKYFNTYKKTMDFIIQAKNAGKVGAKNKKNKGLNNSESGENKQALEAPLQEPLKGTLNTLEDTLPTNNKLLNINNKELIINNKPKKEKKGIVIPSISEFMDYYKNQLSSKFPNLDFQVQTKYESWIENNWKDGNNKPIINWKTKLNSTISYLKPSNNGTQFTKLTREEQLAKRFEEIDRAFGVNQEPTVSETISERTIFDDYEEIS